MTPVAMSWPELLGSLVRREDQTAEATAWAMQQILEGEATPAQLAAFVIALRSKGETVLELSGLADVMITFATPIEVAGPAVDVVGSGGDRSNTVNISTMAAIVAAAAGARALRHAGPVRSQLGIPTIFNFLGPLANPAQPIAQAVGVADTRMAELMAGVF